MQSLARRHDDRAARKAANKAEFEGGTTSGLSEAINLSMSAFDALASLSDEDKKRHDAMMKDYEGASALSLSESPDGSGDTMAGIGVINTAVVPAAVLASAKDNGSGKNAGWGDTPPLTVEPLPVVDKGEGNVNGRALADQGLVTPDGGAKASAEGSAPTAPTPTPAPAA